MKKLAKAVTAVLAVGALGTLVFMRMTKKEEPMEAVPDPSVQVENPAADTISISTDLTGTVEPADVVYVAAMGSGEVLEVYVNQGEMVEKDQTLFKIDNKQLESARIQLNTAKVSLDDAQTNLNRMKVLYDSGDISAQAYEQVVNGVSMAKLQYDGARLNYDIQLENSTVTAPISGLLESFDVKVHDMMAAGSVAAVISGAGNKSVAFSVSERVREGLHPGDAMTVEKNGTEYNGVITEIATMVDQQTGLFKIKASLEGTDALATGTVVKLSVISEKAENVMTVPVDCVSYSGGQEEYIKVELIPEKLAQYHLNMNTIAQCVGSADFSMPIGSTTVGNKKLSVTSGTDFDTIELLKKIPITLGNGNIIYLEDVAEVYSTLEEKSSIGRYNGKDTIALGIKKNQESSNMEVSRDVLKIVDDLKADDPALEVVVINDSSESISSSLESVFQTMIMAVVVSMVIIWLFFGDMKASLIVGTSIPVSILAALILMKAMGFSLNVITLSSLVLGVGMMVDNSIVVLESCFRNTKGGGFVEARNAALDGTKAVLESIIGGTVTTCVVFIPLALIKGMSGQMFKPLGFTIVFCMVASLISAMTIVPLCYTFYRPKEKTENPASRMLRAMQDGYRSLVRKLLRHKALVMITSVVLLVLSFMMAGQLKMELMVADDPGIIGITVETQPGLTIDRVNDVLVKVEDYITKDADLDSYMLSYGSSGLSMGGSGASITAYLKDDKSRETDQVLKEWKRELQKWPDCSISLEKQSSLGSTMTMNQADQVSYILVSTQYDELKEVSDAIVEELQALTLIHI